jgi:hypothetical protein
MVRPMSATLDIPLDATRLSDYLLQISPEAKAQASDELGKSIAEFGRSMDQLQRVIQVDEQVLRQRVTC